MLKSKEVLLFSILGKSIQRQRITNIDYFKFEKYTALIEYYAS